MIQLIETKNTHLIRSVFPDDLRPDLEHTWLLIYNDKQIAGIFELQPISRIAVNVHMHIKEELQNRGLALRSYRPLLKYIKTQTRYNVMISMIGSLNKSMLRVINKTAFKCTGIVPKAIINNNTVQDLILFTHSIRD